MESTIISFISEILVFLRNFWEYDKLFGKKAQELKKYSWIMNWVIGQRGWFIWENAIGRLWLCTVAWKRLLDRSVVNFFFQYKYLQAAWQRKN